MTNYDDDRFLRNILLDIVEEEYATELASPGEVATSLRFRRQMKRMLANPNAWAKQRQRPLWQKFLQKAAVFLLICSVTFGAVMATSPTVRATVIEWVVEWYETHVVYRFFGDSDLNGVPRYDITELPTGYNSVGEVTRLIESVIVKYKNKEETAICLEYAQAENGSALIVNTENMEVSAIKVDGHYGYLYLSSNSQESNLIIWYDEQEKIQFMIDGFVTKEDLLKMADSVSLCKLTK